MPQSSFGRPVAHRRLIFIALRCTVALGLWYPVTPCKHAAWAQHITTPLTEHTAITMAITITHHPWVAT